MKYYVISTEQLHAEGGGYSEYATKGDGKTEKQATSDYFNKLGAVNADLSPNGHTFMDIKLVNSTGDVIKHEKLGAYVNTDE